MGPRFDLNLLQQPDCDDETVGEAAGEKVMPEQSPVLIPAGIDDHEAILPLRISKRLQGAIYRNLQQTRPDINLSPASTIETIDGDKLILPCRISKRLQAAMYRRLEQRNGKSPDNIIATTRATSKDKKSAVLPRSRKVKREEETLSPEPGPVAEFKSSIRFDVKPEVMEAGSQGNIKRKRETFAVDLNEREPLSPHSDDEKKSALKISKKISKTCNLKSRYKAAFKRAENCNLNSCHDDKKRAVVMSTQKSSFHAFGNKKQKVPPPMCFQLLHCNHVGHKGWRCYRPSAEGKFFCEIH